MRASLIKYNHTTHKANMNRIYFSQTKPNSIVPTKRDEDAGFDLYACFEENELVINPGGIAIVPTGIATAFDSNMVLFVKERSSTGSIGLSLRMGVVDSGYRGELMIGLNNTTQKQIILTKEVKQVVKEENRILYPYTKAIAQGVFLFLPQVESEQVSYEELLAMKSDRMLDSMGKSGK
jgi:dUTP pyrophosphatase